MQEYTDNFSNYEEGVQDDGFQYDTGGNILTGSADENKELDNLVSTMMSVQGVGMDQEYHCNVCGKIMKKKRHMMAHVETHVEGLSHQCPLCQKMFKTRNSLDKHRFTYHKGVKFPSVSATQD